MSRYLRVTLFLLAAAVPAVRAQYPGQIYVYSILTIESGVVSGECGAIDFDPTPWLYRGIISDCNFPISGSAAEGQSSGSSWQCRSWEETSCAGPVTASGSGTGTEPPCNPNVETDTPCSDSIGVQAIPGQSYSITVGHTLYPVFDVYNGHFIDPLGYSYNPIYNFSSAGSIFPYPTINPACPEDCGFITNNLACGCVYVYAGECDDPECSIFLATTTDTATAIGLFPTFDTLGPTQTEDFTASIPASWLLAGPGTLPQLVGLTDHYTAPAHLASEQTATVRACDPAHTSNCATAQITLRPIDVFVTPTVVDLIPGVPQKFAASINFTDLPSTVTWTTVPASNPPSIDSNGLYTPPPPAQVPSPLTVTIKACSTVDNLRCGMATATVKPVTITVSAPASANPFLAAAGATLQFSSTVFGTSETAVTWSMTSPQGVMGTGSIDATTGLYRASLSPVLTSLQHVQIKACLVKNPQICSSPFDLTIVPPVVITTIAPALNAGQTLQITITGSGFGGHPDVHLSDPLIGFTVAPLQNPNQQIILIASTPVLAPSELVTVTVTDTDSGLFLAPRASSTVVVNPVALTPAIAPAAATLQEGQSQQFAATFSCRTAGGVACQVPQTAIWSLNPSLGTLTPDGRYTATASVSTQTQVFLKACAAVNPLVCTNPAVITLVPTVVTVSPASVQLADGRTQQFTAAVTGNSVTSVTWSITPAVGTISAGGLYTAPNPVTSPQAVTVKACSTVDGSRCGTAIVNLIAVRLSPASLAFAPQAVGTSSAAQTVTLTNGSPAALTISGISISNPDFALGTGGTCGTSLAANASCTLNVVFQPTATGARTATLTVNDSVATSPQTVSLSGTGTLVSLSPSSLTFAPQNVGTTSGPQTLTLTNSSPTALAISGIALAVPFAQTNDCGSSLAANASCTITVTFSSATPGPFTATLTVTDGAANSPQTATLAGSALLIPAVTGITPAAVTVGSTGFTLEVTGTSFNRGAVVQVNGAARPTTIFSATRLKAEISATDLAAVGRLDISVLDLPPYGGQSGTVPLTVGTTPIPLIGSLSPPRVVVGSPGFTLLVNGSNFSSDAVVRINGVDHATTFNGAAQLAVPITAAEIAHSGLLTVSVASPSSGGSANTVALSAFRYGDLNFDDSITINDLSQMSNYMAGNLTLLDNATADLNLDGLINVSDLNILANYLAGNIHSLPVTP